MSVRLHGILLHQTLPGAITDHGCVTAEDPVTKRISSHEPVARPLVTGRDRQKLRPIVREIERELIERHVAKVETLGLPAEE